jgi:hypothetical protein
VAVREWTDEYLARKCVPASISFICCIHDHGPPRK